MEKNYKNINKTENKNEILLNESLSSRLFHFCNIDAAYNILRINSFKLANVSQNKSDKRMNSFQYDVDDSGNPINKTYEYYMCFSRTPSTSDGYVRQRRISDAKWRDVLVRIEFDGNLLNTKYKGKAVNAFPNTKETFMSKKASDLFADGLYVYPKGKGDLQKKEFNFSDETKIPSIFEHEDRLFSNKPTIENVKKYIKEVDILIDKKILYDPNRFNNEMAKISFVINCFNNVHIYDNEKSFNTLNVRDSKNLDILFRNSKERKGDYQDVNIKDFRKKYRDNLNTKVNNELALPELNNLAKLLPVFAFNSKNYKGKYLKDAMKLGVYIGLTKNELKVVQDKLLRFEDYRSNNFAFIRMLDQILNKTITDISIKRPETGDKLKEIIERERAGKIKSICYAKWRLANKLYGTSNLNEEAGGNPDFKFKRHDRAKLNETKIKQIIKESLKKLIKDGVVNF